MPHLSFDAWLRGIRAQKDLSQVQAAEEIGISKVLYQGWERGDLPVKIAHAMRLAIWTGEPRTQVFERIATEIDRAAAA